MVPVIRVWIFWKKNNGDLYGKLSSNIQHESSLKSLQIPQPGEYVFVIPATSIAKLSHCDGQIAVLVYLDDKTKAHPVDINLQDLSVLNLQEKLLHEKNPRNLYACRMPFWARTSMARKLQTSKDLPEINWKENGVQVEPENQSKSMELFFGFFHLGINPFNPCVVLVVYAWCLMLVLVMCF